MPESDPTSVVGPRSSAISNLTVRLLSEYTGRGPTRARTYFNDNMVTVVLEDSLTKGERVLRDSGHRELVLATRARFQDVMGGDLVAGVEQILQRKVIAFLSANHIDPDYAIETFLLAPQGDMSLTFQRGRPAEARHTRGIARSALERDEIGESADGQDAHDRGCRGS